VVYRRVVRRRRAERTPATLSAGQVGAVVDACGNVRDRLIVEALYATGLRRLVRAACRVPCGGGGIHRATVPLSRHRRATVGRLPAYTRVLCAPSRTFGYISLPTLRDSLHSV
jgi:hypothetical protein